MFLLADVMSNVDNLSCVNMFHTNAIIQIMKSVLLFVCLFVYWHWQLTI